VQLQRCRQLAQSSGITVYALIRHDSTRRPRIARAALAAAYLSAVRADDPRTRRPAGRPSLIVQREIDLETRQKQGIWARNSRSEPKLRILG
jgi:hypothetical protein